MKKFTAELIGTFNMVLVGTGAMIINDISGGTITHAGIALSFGLIIMIMIYTLGSISGAHLNPAVSIGFYLSGRLTMRDTLFYILNQCLGALLASLLLSLLFPQHTSLGATLPADSNAQAFLLETLLTFILMFVIINVSIEKNLNKLHVAFIIGATVGLAALFAGPISGASMNPARSLGPAFISGNIGHLWIYITAPIIGATLAIAGCRCVRSNNCCSLKKQYL